MPLVPKQWLVNHSLFDRLREGAGKKPVWAVFAETFSPLIYSVPAFLGITLARADSYAGRLLDEVWAEELGTNGSPSHPVLFERLHRVATRKWGSFHHLHNFGVKAACDMVSLCGSGPWPFGVAAMLAHEGQFPSAYSSILSRAFDELGEAAIFFEIHSTADIQHTSSSSSLLSYAIKNRQVEKATLEAAYKQSENILRELADHASEVLS